MITGTTRKEIAAATALRQTTAHRSCSSSLRVMDSFFLSRRIVMFFSRSSRSCWCRKVSTFCSSGRFFFVCNSRSNRDVRRSNSFSHSSCRRGKLFNALNLNERNRPESRLYDIQTISSYLTVNTLRLHYKQKRSMQFRAMTAADSKNHMNDMRNAEFFTLNHQVVHRHNCALKGCITNCATVHQTIALIKGFPQSLLITF